MPMGMEDKFTSRNISTSREPVGPKNASSKGSVGDKALMDAVCIVVAAWIVLFMLGFSLRSHNV
jgi:hypothetical protein